MGRWVFAERVCASESYVWIRAGPQLVVGAPGSGDEMLGKWSGSLKGSNNSINTGVQSKEPGRNVIRKT